MVSYIDTRFLRTDDVVEVVRRQGLAVTLAGMQHYLREDFLRWPQFSKCARVAHHAHVGVIELMPIGDAHTYTFKYVNGHPGNTRLGLPTVMAFGMLAHVDTGAPELVSELTLTTALRTAVTSALAASLLARCNSRTLALIGNGAQSEFQALAFHHLLGITTVRLFDVDPAATAKLQANLATTPLQCVVCRSVDEAVQGADVVTTITADKALATVLQPHHLAPGMHINAVGGDCPGKTELAADVLRAASVFVEYEPQTRIEGDLQQMPPDFAVTELWQVLHGQAEGRVHDDQVTVFDSVGFALEDFSALRYMRDASLQLGLGQPLPLMAHTADPKDLFGLLMST